MAEARQSTVLDTGLQYLGTVYAKALIAAAEKTGTTELVLSELDSLVEDVLQRLPTLERTLNSPRVSFESKESLLEKAFRGKMSAQMINFLKVLARHGRFSAVRAVRQAARRIFNELRGILEVYVTTAESIDSATHKLVVEKLKAALGREIDLTTTVNPDLLGGVQIRVGDTVYDGSLANQLARLRKELVSTASVRMRTEVGRFAVAN
jgi:F-type H+-transporting ATPase subunit delta